MPAVLRLVAVAAGLALSAGPAPAAEPPPRVEIVVDSSVDMSTALTDGHSKLDAVRRALPDVLLRLPPDGGDATVSLHLLGSRRPWWTDDACSDLVTVTTERPVDHDRLSAAVDGLHPTGLRSLEAALDPILDRPRADDGAVTRIVLVLGGDSDCPADRARLLDAVEAAGDRLELRIVGVGMPHAVATGFTGDVPVRNALNLKDLVGALREAIRGPAPRRPPRSDLEVISPTPIPPDLHAEVVAAAGGEPDVLKTDGARITGRLLPGRYSLRIVTDDGDVVAERAPIDVATGADPRIELAPSPPSPPSIELTPARPSVGSTVWVRRWGDPAPGARWAAAVAREDAPPDSWEVRAVADEGVSEVELVVPEAGAGRYQLRLLEGPIHGPWAVVARHTWEPVRPAVLVQTAPEVETGAPLEIGWRGPALPGDRIEVQRSDPAAPASTVCVRVLSEEGRTTVRAPLEPGTYRVRYLLGPVRGVATTRSLELFEILARLEAPTTVNAGAAVEIVWEGPAGPQDFLAIAQAGAPDDAYGPWTPADGGSPSVLTAPREPGAWEIRYVSGDSGEVLARASLTVETVGITLTAPRRVTAGTRFDVAWTGTGAPGDIVVVAPAGSPTTRVLDWASTDAGSPVSLAAPFAPGAFEIRFVRPSTREILASTPLEAVK